MKIQKIKSQGVFVYPATIAAAVKDANFRKDDGTPPTQSEINSNFDERLKKLEELTDGETTEF